MASNNMENGSVPRWEERVKIFETTDEDARNNNNNGVSNNRETNQASDSSVAQRLLRSQK